MRAIASSPRRVGTGADLGERGSLGARADRVRLAQRFGKLAGRERASAVGAVAVNLRAEVDDHGFAGAELAIAGMVMRKRGIRARADDRLEGDVVGALLVDRAHDPPGDIGLRPADDALPGEAREDRVDDLRGSSDRVELGGLLDRAQHHRHGRDRDELDSRREQVGVARNRDVVGLEGDRRVGEPPELRRDPG